MKTSMCDQFTRLRRLVTIPGLLLAFAAATPAVFAQVTTSGLSGRITADTQLAMGNANVTVTHEPTGSVYQVPVRANGSFTLRGLRPGGPYTVEVAADGFSPAVQRDVYLDLDRVGEVTVALRAVDVVDLEAFVVSGTPFDAYFQADRMGAGTKLSSEDVASIPVGDRSLNSLLRLDPRLVYNRDPSDRAFSAAGASNRYNSIQIDGVSASDPFGLSANNTAAERNVIPLDSVAAVSVATSPFDVRAGGFTGAQVNAVTKSGTNTTSGTVYYLYRDQSMVRKNQMLINGNNLVIPDFKEQTFGFTVGGAIIPNKLFYFVAFEKVMEDKNPPSITNFVTADALTRIVNQANALGINPGLATDTVSLKLTDNNILVKLDWNINQDHRFTFRFNTVESARPTFPNYGGRNLSFDSHWYSQEIENTSFIGQLFSNWTNDFSTEISLSRSEYISAPIFDARTPMIRINNVPVQGTNQLGIVHIGTERSRHFNLLEVTTWTFELVGRYELGLKNTLSFGYQMDKKEVFNAFVQDMFGNYEFTNIDEFEKAAAGGWLGRYQYKFATPGINPAAEFNEVSNAVFIQNTFRPFQALTVVAGVRYDAPHFGDKPAYNALFEQTFGFANNHTYSGKGVFQPRIGFNYHLDDKMTKQLRGGFGLFAGTMPRVWISNSYSNTGFNFNTVDVSNANTPAFSPNPDSQPVPGVSAVTQTVVALDPNFELPSSWKATLAYDHQMFEHVFSIEAEFSWVNKDVLFKNINRTIDTVAGDGREIFGPRVSNRFANDIIMLQNTNKGDSRSVVLSVERPKTESGWYYKVSYTNGKVNEVHYGTSSVARSNWANRMILNNGEDVTSRGELEIQHRILGILRKDFNWAKGFATRVSLIYEGRSGLPYSFRYSTDVNGDGVNGNDLLYVPNRSGDPLVRFNNAASETAFWALVDKHGLKEGEVVKAGHARYPFSHQFDLNLSQEVKLPGWKHSLEIGLDILNIGNLIDSSWGVIRGSNNFFVKSETAVAATYDKPNGQYVYSNVNDNLSQGLFNPHTSRGEPNSSRWSAMLSVRYKF
jgi:hypothetical protein